MIDYVKCQECGIEKSREDTFLDIPLPIRPFGSTNAYGCIVRIIFTNTFFI
jgi:ubiquitin carboxyl-terminal hydrolase 47